MSVFTERMPLVSTRPDGPCVRGPRAMTEVTGWCAVLMVCVNVGIGLLLMLLALAVPGLGGVGYVLVLAAFVALVPVVVVGWPVGLLTAWGLRRVDDERRHVAVFAVVGATTALALTAVLVVSDGPLAGLPPGALLVVAAEGALGAGGARWAAGAARRRLAWAAPLEGGRAAPGAGEP